MWLLIPSLNPSTELDSAPARADSNSDLKSLFPDTGASVWWNGKSRSPADLRRAFLKDQSLKLLSGMTLPPSTASRGVELFQSFLRASLASRSASPENEKEPATNDGFGPISPGSSEKPGPISVSSKTSPDSCSTPIATLTDGKWMGSQLTLLGGWEPYSGAWPNSGSLVNGQVFERPTSALPTAVSESLFWPTGTVGDAKRGDRSEYCAADRKAGMDLQTAANQWRTPDSPGSGGPRNRQGSIGHGHQTTIGEQAEHWQTPATDSFRSRGGDRKNEMGLDQEARLWASPQARDHRSGETIENYGNARPLNEQVVNWATPDAGVRGGFNQSPSENAAKRPLLKTQSENWNTPRAEDSESCGNHPGRAGDSLTGQTKMWGTPKTATGGYQYQRNGDKILNLQGQAMEFQSSLPDQPPQSGNICWCNAHGCALPGHKRKLNPIFVTWLMGWPLWWLLSAQAPLGRLGMGSYLYRQRSHLSRLLAGF